MNEGAVGSIGTAKRSDTAELRKRFDAITDLLADGFNHKQICEHLNTQGLAIPYPQYRAIMTRLRREKAQPGKTGTQPTELVSPLTVTVRPALSQAPPKNASEPVPQHQQDRKISWDPMSEANWK